jgi:hypothetical protein
MHDAMNKMALRSLLASTHGTSGVNRLRDHEVLEQVAWRLASNQFRMVEPPVRDLARDLPQADEAAEEAEEVPAPVAAVSEPEDVEETYRWIGYSRSLFDDRTVEFKEFLPFRPRGAQVVLDPFEPQTGDNTISGMVLSPARELDPGSDLQVWCDGQSISLNGSNSFQFDANLHAGADQIHVRALDATLLQGRAFIGTWIPDLDEDDSDDGRPPLLDHTAGECDPDNPPPVVRKPIRYGRTRAEVQRFAILPARVRDESADLVLKDENQSEIGRVTVALTHEGKSRSLTEWVCITATDPLADPPPEAVEGKILRVPSLESTLEIHLSDGTVLEEPLRMSGLDYANSLTAIHQVDDPSHPVALDVVFGGRYKLDALNLSWMTTSDADAVLLPGEGVDAGTDELAGSLSGRAAELGEAAPVDMGQGQVRMPSGWGALTFEGREATDPWEHDEVLDVVTYKKVAELDSPEGDDFVHTGRPPRVQWHPTEEWAVHPDQIIVKLEDDTGDGDLADLCKTKGLRVAGTVRRDEQILLESPEPLDLDELLAVVDGLQGESIIEHAAVNYTMFCEAENVSTIRVPDVMRGGAAIAPQPGCYRPYDILTIRHHLQTRAFPAQQIIHHLRFQQTPPQTQIGLGITDDGFGNTTLANISPDFSMPRLPWLGRNSNMGAGPGAGTWAAFPANVGATQAFTSAAMTDPAGPANPHLAGHGTRTSHVMAGHGTTFIGLQSTAPPLAPAAAGIANYPAASWCVGVNPFAQVFPIRPTGTTIANWFPVISAIRFAFLQGCQVVNTSMGWNYPTIAAAASPAYLALVTPMLAQARAAGNIWVVSGGNSPLPHNRHAHSHLAATGARNAATNLVVAATPNSVTLLPVAPQGPNFPLTFTNPWNSAENRVTWANRGPESTVAAPGEDLNLRAYSLTAASTPAQLARGSGSSFAAPQVAGLLGLMKMANAIMGHAVGRPTVPTAADAANRLIDLMCFTAHKDQPLFNAGENAAQFSNLLGHGRIDNWAAVLSALNDGPMFAGTAPHVNLVNTGTYIWSNAPEIFWGFELDTPAYHARPWLVNVNTGVCERITDSLSLDPVIDRTDVERPAWTYQVRAGGAGDQILPPSSHPGPTPSYMLQFTIRKTRLQNYTHLCFQRGANEPPIVATPGSPDLEAGAPAPNLVYYGLPLVPLMNHRTTGADIAPFRVDMRHFIFKAHTNQHDRRLRITFDRVVINGAVAGDSVEVQWTVGGAASGYRRHFARQNATTFLGGASHVFYQPDNAALNISFEVRTLGTANSNYQPPATPTATNFTPWGLGYRFMEVAGQFRVYFRVEQEPNLPRGWRVALNRVRLRNVPVGRYIFAVESGGVRSGWSAPTNVAAVTPQIDVAVPAATVVARSPFVPNHAYQSGFRFQNLADMSTGQLTQQPASMAMNAVENMTLITNPVTAEGTFEVRSEVVPQVFA